MKYLKEAILNVLTILSYWDLNYDESLILFNLNEDDLNKDDSWSFADMKRFITQNFIK